MSTIVANMCNCHAIQRGLLLA